MKPRVVRETTPTLPQARGAPYQGVHPEHNFQQSLPDWGMAVFDNAILFSVAWFKGRGNKGRKDYADLEAAIADCRSNDRSVIYAATATGRFFCLDRANFDTLLVRWKSAKNVD